MPTEQARQSAQCCRQQNLSELLLLATWDTTVLLLAAELFNARPLLAREAPGSVSLAASVLLATWDIRVLLAVLFLAHAFGARETLGSKCPAAIVLLATRCTRSLHAVLCPANALGARLALGSEFSAAIIDLATWDITDFFLLAVLFNALALGAGEALGTVFLAANPLYGFNLRRNEKQAKEEPREEKSLGSQHRQRACSRLDRVGSLSVSFFVSERGGSTASLRF